MNRIHSGIIASNIFHLQQVYFILKASLMGVLRHHALIPWDDDIDVVMVANQWPRIRNVLGNIKGCTLYTTPMSHMTRTTPISGGLTNGLKHDLLYAKGDIFPLQLRPFEGLMVPVPCNIDLVVYKSHDRNKCVTPEYVHKTNKNNYLFGVTSIDCKLLYEFYPFMFEKRQEGDRLAHEHLLIHYYYCLASSFQWAPLPDVSSFVPSRSVCLKPSTPCSGFFSRSVTSVGPSNS